SHPRLLFTTHPLALCFSLIPRRPPPSTLFPYTTLFRSTIGDHAGDGAIAADAANDVVELGMQQRLAATDGNDGGAQAAEFVDARSEEHTSELQSPCNLVCRLLLEKKKKKYT